MISFKIYKKSAKFFWTRKRKTEISFSVIIVLVILKLTFSSGSENSFIEKCLLIAGIFILAYGLINPVRNQQLKGKLEGLVILKIESITIEDRILDLHDIKLVKFEVFDFVDKLQGDYGSIYRELFSAGVDNKITIILYTGEVIVRNFQLKDEHGMLRAYRELNTYYNQKKMLKRDYDLIFD